MISHMALTLALSLYSASRKKNAAAQSVVCFSHLSGVVDPLFERENTHACYRINLEFFAVIFFPLVRLGFLSQAHFIRDILVRQSVCVCFFFYPSNT